jgi:UMP-CMP kinase
MEQSGCTRFLIDGFPRNEDNNNEWKALMKDSASVKFLLFLDCPEEEMEKRILRRAADSGRIDDNITSLRKRFVTYREQTMPVIASYESSGLVRQVDATRDPETVFAELHAMFLKEFGTAAVRPTA